MCVKYSKRKKKEGTYFRFVLRYDAPFLFVSSTVRNDSSDSSELDFGLLNDSKIGRHNPLDGITVD